MLTHSAPNLSHQLVSTLLDHLCHRIISTIIGLLILIVSTRCYFSLHSELLHKCTIVLFIWTQVAILFLHPIFLLSFLLRLSFLASFVSNLANAYLVYNHYDGQSEEKQRDSACQEEDSINNFGLFDKFRVCLTHWIFEVINKGIAQKGGHDYEHNCEHNCAGATPHFQISPCHWLLLTATAQVNSEDAMQEGSHYKASVEAFKNLQTFASLSLPTFFVAIWA